MRLALMAAACLVAAAAIPAHAQEPTANEAEMQRARVYFQAGMAYFEEGDYESAIPQFERALEISQAPELLYNLFISYERVGGFQQASVYLRSYLSVAEVEPADRQRLRSRLEALERRAERTTDPGADEGDPEASEGDPSEASEANPSATVASAEPGVDPEATEPSRSYAGPITAFGVAGAGLVTFAVAGIFALGEDSDLDETCGPACSADEVAGLERMTLTADIGLGIAAAGAVVGVLWLFLGGDDDEAVAVTPVAGPQQAGMVWHGSF